MHFTKEEALVFISVCKATTAGIMLAPGCTLTIEKWKQNSNWVRVSHHPQFLSISI